MLKEIFSILGAHINIYNIFDAYIVNSWETPSFSPIILKDTNSFNKYILSSLDEHFSDNPINNPFIKQTPYFNFILKNEREYSDRSIIADLPQEWHLETTPLYINILVKQIPLKVPISFKIHIQETVNNKKELNNDYVNLIKNNFYNSDEYIKYMKKVFSNSNISSYTVMIYDNNNTVGGGTVTIKGDYSFLSWGAISPNYRKQGLHQLLLSCCQMVSKTLNSTYCALTTRNERIRGKSEMFIKLGICRKNNIQK